MTGYQCIKQEELDAVVSRYSHFTELSVYQKGDPLLVSDQEDLQFVPHTDGYVSTLVPKALVSTYFDSCVVYAGILSHTSKLHPHLVIDNTLVAALNVYTTERTVKGLKLEEPLPGWCSAEKVGLSPNMPFEYYYEALCQLFSEWKQGEGTEKGKDEGNGEDKRPDDSSSSVDGAGEGETQEGGDGSTNSDNESSNSEEKENSDGKPEGENDDRPDESSDKDGSNESDGDSNPEEKSEPRSSKNLDFTAVPLIEANQCKCNPDEFTIPELGLGGILPKKTVEGKALRPGVMWKALMKEITRKWAHPTVRTHEEYGFEEVDRRHVLMPSHFAIPKLREEEKVKRDKTKIYLFLDCSGSCHSRFPVFSKLSLTFDPELFEVSVIGRSEKSIPAEKIVERNGEIRFEFKNVDCGDSFITMERLIQKHLGEGVLKEYPVCIHVTDAGDCTPETPLKTEEDDKWYWILLNRGPADVGELKQGRAIPRGHNNIWFFNRPDEWFYFK